MSNISFITDLFKKITDHPDAVQTAGPTPTYPVQTMVPPIGLPPQVAEQTLNIPQIDPVTSANPNVPSIPVNAPDTTVHPRIVPNVPQMTPEDAGASMQSAGFFGRVPDIPTGQATAPNVPAITAGPLDDMKQRSGVLGNKQYNVGTWEKDGKTTHNRKTGEEWVKDGGKEVTPEGKDRAKTWSLSTKILSAIAGWAQGGLIGGVRAATDRNYFSRMGDANEQARLLPQIEAMQGIEANDAKNIYTQAQTVLAAARPELMAKESARKAAKDASEAQYKQDLITLGYKKAIDIKGWRDQIIDLKDRGLDQNDVKIKQLDKKIEETARHNKEVEKVLGSNAEVSKGRLKLDEQKFGQAKVQFETIQKRLQDAMTLNDQTAISSLRAKLTQMMQSAEQAHAKGELDDDQYNALMQMITVQIK